MNIKIAWESFERLCVPAELSDIYKEHLKMAFYAGSTTVIRCMMEIGEKSISNEEGSEIFQALLKECEDYREELQVYIEE